MGWSIPVGKPEVVKKVWGEEVILANEPEYCGKLLRIDAGMQCSLHCHHRKKETFYVQEGPIFMQIGSARLTAIRGERFTILPGTRHRFGSVHGGSMIEISMFHDDTDVERFEESGPLPRGDK